VRATTTYLQCCLLLACVWPLQAQQPAVRDELIHIEKKWAEAGVKGDIGFFERTATADYVIVDCDGSVRNKQQEISNFRQETQTSQAVEDMKVRVYGRTAVVVGAFTITGTYAGQPNNLTGNFTDVWIRPDRTWQLVSTHNTCKPADAENSAALDTLEKNKAVLRRAHEEVWSKGNLETADELYDPNYVYHATYGPDEKGLELFKKGVKDQHIAFPDWNEQVMQIIAAGDIVVTRFISSGTHRGPWVGIPPTGRRLKVQEIAIHRLANGKIVEQWDAGDWDQAEKQLGITLPAPDSSAGNPLLPQDLPDSFFVTKEKEVWEALRKHDKSAATRLLADDFVGMYDFGFFTKAEWVKQIDDQYMINDYTIEDAKVLHPSQTTALLLYKSKCKGAGEWAEYCSHTQRISDLWVKRDDQWLALFSQDTEAK